MSKISRTSPCEVRVQPQRDGGLQVDLFVPTSDGGIVVTIAAERDHAGDWVVTVPTSRDMGLDGVLGADPEMECFLEGVVYMAAPEGELDRQPSAELSPAS